MERFKQNNQSDIIWYPIDGDIIPVPDCNYLVTIKENQYSDKKVVTIGSYNYNPFKEKYEWLHGSRTIAFAVLPKPY